MTLCGTAVLLSLRCCFQTLQICSEVELHNSAFLSFVQLAESSRWLKSFCDVAQLSMQLVKTSLVLLFDSSSERKKFQAVFVRHSS